MLFQVWLKIVREKHLLGGLRDFTKLRIAAVCQGKISKNDEADLFLLKCNGQGILKINKGFKTF